MGPSQGFGRAGRRVYRVALALGIAAGLAGAVSPAASPTHGVSVGWYSVALDKTVTSDTEGTQTFTFTVTNCDARCGLGHVSLETLDAATLTFPEQFSVTPFTDRPIAVTSPLGGLVAKHWTASATVQGVVTLRAASAPAMATNDLAPGESVTVAVQAAAEARSASSTSYPIVSTATGPLGDGPDGLALLALANAGADPAITVVGFRTQPTLTSVNSEISPMPPGPVQVSAVPGTPVTLRLPAPSGGGNNRVGGELSEVHGTSTVCDDEATADPTATVCTETADAGGIATFHVKIDREQPDYVLVATNAGINATSDLFSVTNDFTEACPNGGTTTTCNGSGDDERATPTRGSVTATFPTAFGGSWRPGARLGISFVDNDGTPDPYFFPPGVCSVSGVGSSPPIGSGVRIDIHNVDSSNDPVVPDKTVTLEIHKADLLLAGTDRGAAKYELCLGAKKETTECRAAPTLNDCSFATKNNGGSAVYVQETGRYWGLLLDCGAKELVTRPEDPCVLKKQKTGAGDLVIVFRVRSRFDESGWGV